MAPDTPEREPEMQDTPPCQLSNQRRCLAGYLLFLICPVTRATEPPGVLPDESSLAGCTFSLSWEKWEIHNQYWEIVGKLRERIEVYRERFYEALETCGIDNPIIEVNGQKRRTYTPHSCRHTFATMMKNVKAADKDKLALIGHTSTEMLRHYQDTEIEGLRKIINAMEAG